jgi:hypothetical protein
MGAPLPHTPPPGVTVCDDLWQVCCLTATCLLTTCNWLSSKSKSHCNWWSVSQQVLVLSLFDSYSFFSWGALSDRRTGLSFIHAAGPCQHSLSRVWAPWNSQPYFTVSDLRLPFSSPPTTCRVTVEVFDPASTWGCNRPSKSKSHCDWRSVSQ